MVSGKKTPPPPPPPPPHGKTTFLGTTKQRTKHLEETSKVGLSTLLQAGQSRYTGHFTKYKITKSRWVYSDFEYIFDKCVL
jgi:hypothetical protein